jgi:hypothetical protein
MRKPKFRGYYGIETKTPFLKKKGGVFYFIKINE